MVLDENDLCNLVMQGRDVTSLKGVTIDRALGIEQLITALEDPKGILTWTFENDLQMSVPEFDLAQQQHWYMPEQYQQMDIAEHVLGLCNTQEQLQRVGEELLMYQEHDLFDLLRYLKYLVDTMRENQVIWGVGRGSSVASYVLYLIGVHRIDSMFYDLDPREFLR